MYEFMYAPTTKCTIHDGHSIDYDAPGVGGTGKVGRTSSHQSSVKPSKVWPESFKNTPATLSIARDREQFSRKFSQ